MTIITVKPGDTLESIASAYGAAPGLLAIWNEIENGETLVPGQSILILETDVLHTVRAGESIFSIASLYGIEPKKLLAFNPGLDGGYRELAIGQTLVISFAEESSYPLRVNGYAYPFIREEVLLYSLPYLTYLAPFTYGFTESGTLIPLDDERLLAAARDYGVSPLLHLSTLTESGNFSDTLATTVLRSPAAEETLIENVIATALAKGYGGIDVDFEFLGAENALPYADFIARLRERGNAVGLTVLVALAPKTSDTQSGILYEGHNYRALGEAANAVFLMTYEWGYTYGPPMAIAPIGSVQRVLDYAVTEIDPGKIFMGMPNYAYDWVLPYQQGETRATSISNREAIQLARRYGAEIQYDETSQTPYFSYFADDRTHEVWFEDARSVAAKLELPPAYGFLGVGYWNIMRKFTQNWMILAVKYGIAAP
ncbi:MAG: LysM peptidoglycan-binding domain-containing protein [Ruminococcus sp.]|nr:LysM peptidoglycan-binding domain-containing protein [Candidatus Apopatosoma intestinale]